LNALDVYWTDDWDDPAISLYLINLKRGSGGMGLAWAYTKQTVGAVRVGKGGAVSIGPTTIPRR